VAGKGSKAWLERQHRDAFTKDARARGYRSRAVFKLEQIDRKYHLFRPGMTVVDLGAAPGGWSQYAASRVGPGGSVIALDILEIVPLTGVTFIQGDFTAVEAHDDLLGALGGIPAHAVISDMAPNFSGVRSVDQPRAIYMAELAFELAEEVLAPGGSFMVKLFQGEGFDHFVARCRSTFGKVKIHKPVASRAASREVYLLAEGGR